MGGLVICKMMEKKKEKDRVLERHVVSGRPPATIAVEALQYSTNWNNFWDFW